jgi:uncharacterized membrane protein
MLEDIEKYIKDVVGFKVENILYLYIFEINDHWKNIGRTLGDVRKAPKFYFFK